MGMSMIPVATGAAIGAINSRNEAKQAKALADYNAKLSEREAQQSENVAAQTRRQGYDAMRRSQLEGAVDLGALRAKQGASGAVVDAGSNLDSSLNQAERTATNSAAIFEDANNRAYNNQISAWRQRAEADRQRAAGKMNASSAKSRTILGGINGLGRSALSVADRIISGRG